ncbi:MAG: transposase [Gemmataceae bacterium]|nr:transposase [Gemmataceae bacterium]
MVIASHVIFSAYGFWLPNDPRGSWSEFVRKWELFLAGGKATKTNETRSLAYDPHDRAKRLATNNALSLPPVKFTGIQARALGRGFAEYVQNSNLEVWACSIMPDHIHLVTARHRLHVEQLVIQLKSSATRHLVEEGIHPFQSMKSSDGPPPKCFAKGEWKVFLDSPEDVHRAIRYVENNPIKDGLPPQRWAFVQPPTV